MQTGRYALFGEPALQVQSELPAAETYQALQTGVVDGQDNAPSNIWDFKIYEVFLWPILRLLLLDSNFNLVRNGQRNLTNN